MEIRALEPHDAAGCDAVIRSLPYHFGDPDGIREASRTVRSHRGLVAHDGQQVVAFATTAPASDVALEITWLAVHASRRRSGLGRRLVERIADGAAHEFQLLCALTLAPSVPEPGIEDSYEGTRRFWQRVGFLAVRELDLADWNCAAQLLIRPLGALSGSQRGSGSL